MNKQLNFLYKDLNKQRALYNQQLDQNDNQSAYFTKIRINEILGEIVVIEKQQGCGGCIVFFLILFILFIVMLLIIISTAK